MNGKNGKTEMGEAGSNVCYITKRQNSDIGEWEVAKGSSNGQKGI